MLLDAYVLQISQLVMSDLLFIALLFAAAGVLAWRPRPGLGAVAAAGALLAAAVSVRTVGQPVIVAGLAYVLLAGAGVGAGAGAGAGRGPGPGRGPGRGPGCGPGRCRCRGQEKGDGGVGSGLRRRLVAAGTMAGAFVLVLGGYMVWSVQSYGEWGMGTSHTRVMYARAATFADCVTLDLPVYQRPLCPRVPAGQRPGVDAYMWSTSSPAYHYRPPAGMSKDVVLADFAWRVFTQQPLGLAREAATDFLRGFVPVKADMPGQVPIKRWQFQTAYPQTGVRDGTPENVAERFGGGLPQVDTRLATLLRAYQLGPGHVPGTVVGVCLLLGLLGAVGVGRARHSPLRSACLLFAATGASVLLIAAIFQFSWRYQLPGIVILPVAGALGVTALFHRRKETPPAAPAPAPDLATTSRR
ncbi:MAG: hypothetical protein GEV11_26955 [Streptosporangiales bacterium]|nr:hypothetical protein [Streptosporangiales bacterium]